MYLTDENIAELRTTIKKISCIQLFYIFGSVAKGSPLQPNDIDVAILPDTNMTTKSKIGLREKVLDLIEKIFKLEATVIFINEASPLLKFQVVKYGKLVFERHTGIDSTLRFRIMTEYFEYKELHDFFYKKNIRATYYG